ncbi:MAG: YggS family pyridoxal phosphate-dependent enzyme [Actinomycetota bacterium]|nr:YggS family pyridoxal phosphate-dependent enzyme [Actinomycetota bacterium]
MSDGRARQLAANLAGFEQRLTAACAAAGRARSEVTVIAVTKTFPAADVLALATLGVGDFGENRDGEARAKAAAVPDVRWHFVGRLQRNKCRSVASYADAVHSVDRVEVAAALADGAARAGRLVDVLVQVSLDGDPARGGALPADVPAIAEACAKAECLRLSGVMAVAPMDADPDAVFARLAGVAAALVADHPRADAISAGMSGDLESAVRNGATHVRVGTALLGGRTPPSR